LKVPPRLECRQPANFTAINPLTSQQPFNINPQSDMIGWYIDSGRGNDRSGIACSARLIKLMVRTPAI